MRGVIMGHLLGGIDPRYGAGPSPRTEGLCRSKGNCAQKQAEHKLAC